MRASVRQEMGRVSDEAVRLYFARTLATLREASGLGQKELAARVGLHTSTISKYECGAVSPGLEVLRRLSRELGVGVDTLVGTKGRAPRCAEVELRLNRLAELIEEMPDSGRALILRTFDEIEAEVRKVLRRK